MFAWAAWGHGWAQSTDYDDLDSDNAYASGDFGRVTAADDGFTFVLGDSASARGDYVGVNAPIFPGDAIRTGPAQRVEVELAGGDLVRLDRTSEVRFQSLPSPYGEFVDNTVLGLTDGVLQIVRVTGGEASFRIDTRGGTVYLLGEGRFRIEVGPNGRTRVFSSRGVAELAGDGGSVLVRGGTFSEVFPGAYPQDVEPFRDSLFASDGFERWLAFRDDTREVAVIAEDDGAYEDLPDEVRPYYGELSSHGRWVYLDDYGWSWYPVGVAKTWRPYYSGSWVYGPDGYFWASREPWGWAPYHYGRWTFVSSYGWIWSPGRVFSGAWVSWSFGNSYIGWCPLGYWNRPVYYGTPYYGYTSYSWTFVHHRHITSYDYSRHAVDLRHAGDDLRRNARSTRPPQIAPRELRESGPARERAVAFARADRRRDLVADRIDRTDRAGRARGESFRTVEARGLRNRAARGRPAVAGTGSPRGADTASRGGARAPRRITGRSGTAPRAGRQGGISRFSRRGAPDAATPGPRAGAGNGRARIATPGSRGSSARAVPEGPRVRPRQIRGEDSGRVRDLYRRVAPRSGGSRDAGSAATTPRSGSRGSGSASSGGGASGRSRVVTPRSSTSSRGTSARTAPRPSRPSAGAPRSSGSSRSGSRVTPGRSGGSQRPSATRSGGSRSSSRPSAARSGGSRSSSRPSAARSGGSRSSSRPSAARSGGSRSSSRPSAARSGGNRSSSRPSAARSGGNRSSSRPSAARSGGNRSSGRSATSRSSGRRGGKKD